MSRPIALPQTPDVPAQLLAAVRDDYERFAHSGMPSALEPYLLDKFDLDVSAEYAGYRLKNPWGKASGQLSMTPRQVEEDVRAGLGFVVLKTVIAQDESGTQSMEAWAQRESRMDVEPIVGQSGEQGWTVTWKGRGWWQSFDDYLQLIRDARRAAEGNGTLIVPSCKFHLPAPGETSWNIAEYAWTTPRLLAAWHDSTDESLRPMPLEKDFSPTLAASDRASMQSTVIDWLRKVPDLIRHAAVAGSPDPQSTAIPSKNIRVGLKLFNALFDDDFQCAMLDAIHAPEQSSPDYFIYGNRLFDPNRLFDGHRGAAYGGPDLSDRNLRVMRRFLATRKETGMKLPTLPWSATGNITSGQMALNYALCGASSFQIHTFFQLPVNQYALRTGSRTERSLHELYFHPERGFIVWMHHLAGELGLPRQPIRFVDLVIRARA